MGDGEKSPFTIRGIGRNQDAYDKFSAAVELPLMVITILWIPVLLVPLVRPVHGSVASTFAVIDYMVWALFALEYVIKLYLSPDRGKFVRTHILDLLIVAVPFFRPLRIGRLARLGRVGIVARRAVGRGKSVMTHKGLHFVLLTVAIIIFACAGLVTIAERDAPGSSIHNLGQGLWWAMVTVTTVGYGDRAPVTPLGQGLAVFLMLAGIGLLGVLTATFASYFVGQDLDKNQAEREELDRNWLRRGPNATVCPQSSTCCPLRWARQVLRGPINVALTNGPPRGRSVSWTGNAPG
jgi:voltage-gated potassium channel